MKTNNKAVLPIGLLILWGFGLGVIQEASATPLATKASKAKLIKIDGALPKESVSNIYLGHITGTIIPEWKVQKLPSQPLKYVVKNLYSWKMYEYPTKSKAIKGVYKHQLKHLSDSFGIVEWH